MRIPVALEEPIHAEGMAVKYLKNYYAARQKPGAEEYPTFFKDQNYSWYTGAFFDRWPEEGPDPHPDRFTADDLVSVGFLSVPIDQHAAVQMLHFQAEKFCRMLGEIDTDLDLADVEGSEIHKNWPAWRLEIELRKLPNIGPVRASKLIARKRPRLYPIYDTEVSTLTGTWPEFLKPFHKELQTNNFLRTRLKEAKSLAELPDTISEIRVFDVIAWMEQTHK